LSLGDLSDDRIVPAVAKIAARGIDDKWTRAAALSSIAGREEKFLGQFSLASDETKSESLPLMGAELGHLLAAALPANKLPAALEQILVTPFGNSFSSKTDASRSAWPMAALGGFSEGLKARPNAAQEKLTLLALCKASTGLRSALDSLFQTAVQTAADLKRTQSERLAAIRLLGQTDYQTAGTTLEKLLEPRQPAEMQTAAANALAQISDPSIGPVLVTRDRWNGYTPAVRDAVLTAIMGNTNFIQTLFAAIEKGDVAPLTVNGDRRTQLMRHKDDAIKEKAIALFKDIKPTDRMKIYEESKSVLSLTGASKNGHAVFQKNCTACHVCSGEGHTVGPDLTGIRNQPKDVLLLHIVIPEYEISPIYTCYNVETKDGQTYTGLLAAETPSSITLRMSQGAEQQIPRSNIASMLTSRLSLMPQELEKAMTKQEMADLLAFLKGE
jgi:putative heme-binding domain-containing protein